MRDFVGRSFMHLQKSAISGWIIHFLFLESNKYARLDSNNKLANDGYYYRISEFLDSYKSCSVNLVYEGEEFDLPNFESNFNFSFLLKRLFLLKKMMCI